MTNEQLAQGIQWMNENVIGLKRIIEEDMGLHKVTVLGKVYFVCGYDEDHALDVLVDHLEATNSLMSSEIIEESSSMDKLMYGANCWNFKEEPLVELIYGNARYKEED